MPPPCLSYCSLPCHSLSPLGFPPPSPTQHTGLSVYNLHFPVFIYRLHSQTNCLPASFGASLCLFPEMDALCHQTVPPSEYEGSWVHFCPRCGCPSGNRRPSAKHRRSHKKVCGKGEGYPLVDAERGRFYEHIFMRVPRVDSEPVVRKELKKMILVGDDTGVPMPMAEKHEEDDPLSILGEKNIRTPICCFIGDGANGKTKLIDCISGGSIREGKGVCVGAIYVGEEIIRDRMKEVIVDPKLNVPGLLLIDTPGHQFFTTSRSQGLGLCDIAILVVEIMLGLQPEGIELLKLLKIWNIKFLVALHKIDKIDGWKECRNEPIVKALEQQSETVQFVFNCRLNKIIKEFREQGMKAELYHENNAMRETLSIVPTSAVSGEGVADLLQLLVQLAQETMIEKQSNQNKVQCTVLEVKVVEGHGTAIDVVLVNGVLHEGDQIAVCSMQGPIITNIRALLMPPSMKELEVKGTYTLHKEIRAPQCVRIAAQGLEPVVAGTQLYVMGPDDNLEDIKEAVEEGTRAVRNKIDSEGKGVYLQAATIGTLEALIESLKSPSLNLPVCGIGIGPVRKSDVLEASSLVKEGESAIILALDVGVISEARELANKLGVKIFNSDFIDPLFYRLQSFINSQKPQDPKEDIKHAVFPCVLMPECFSNDKDEKNTCFVGVDVLEGIAKIGTPLCIQEGESSFISVGEIVSIEIDHNPVDYAKKGQKAVIKICNDVMPENFVHLEINYELLSFMTLRSIKAVKDHYKGALSSDEWRLMSRLKEVFGLE